MMKAVGYQHSLPIDDPKSLQDIEIDAPVLEREHDMLVEVKAISVNPVDTKIRMRVEPAAGGWQVLGWDVAGIVREVGVKVTQFKPGDRVWYAGDVTRAGANAEQHLVDARIVGKMPQTVDFVQAAALPLTTLTAYEMLFQRLGIQPGKKPSDKKIMIVGAAGGVGSIMLQLLKRLTNLTVIATASRSQTQDWVRQLGADIVIDHRQPLDEELAKVGIDDVDYVVSLTHTDKHFDAIAKVIAPQGQFGLIDDPDSLDIGLLKRKSVSLHWEFMFTKSMFGTEDIASQGRILSEVAEMLDHGLIETTVAESFGTINAANLAKAHELLESGKSFGKIVLAGF